MSLFQDENDFIISDDDVALDETVKVEETFLNLDCVKEEEPNFKGISNINPFEIKIKFEDVFEENCNANPENEGNLKGMLDDDVTIEEGIVKLENIKDEEKDTITMDVTHFSCNKCAGNYEGYCPNCSSLSHILSNNVILDLNTGLDLNTIPKNILEIRDVSKQKKVIALKALQKGVTFGPLEGVSAVECTNGFEWKIKDWKFVTQGNGNWMTHVACAANRFCKNIDIFQRDRNIYFQTSRKIKEDEELLIHYSDEVMLGLDNGEECYFIPEEKRDSPKIFACTACHLGFRLESCLVEHKSKCPSGDQGRSNEDFEIVECSYCKVWLEKQEHLGRHMPHCLKNYNRMSYIQAQPADRNQVTVEEIEDGLDTEAVHGGFKCSQCSYETNDEKNLQKHLNTHEKPFQCGICMMNFTLKSNLERHIKNKHAENGCAKDYQCSECTYQTNYKTDYQAHLNRHRGIKPFECGICMTKFTRKRNLKTHIKNTHIKKDYQCSACTYQTNDKRSYRAHLNQHRGIKRFECGICKMKFTKKQSLKKHIKNKHAENGSAKDYQCSECPFQTHEKQHYQTHLDRHRGIKPFECYICKMKFSYKSSLKFHIKNKHTENGCAKDYQCPECTFETNDKRHYQRHLNRHRGIKPFECDICKMKFILKQCLKRHIKNKHAENGSAIDYQCSACTYQTNDKRSYQMHLNEHRGIKAFECGICEMKFILKQSLKKHIKNKHAENGSVIDYQCSACTYQTNDKRSYQMHLNEHRGIKAFECGICEMKFILKQSLKKHIKNKHAENGSVIDYQCSACTYQTNDKRSYQMHLNEHRGIKAFECGICEMKFILKQSLKKHIKNKHAENGSVIDYQCSLLV